jgi:predicted nucleic acid-binding protein
MQNASLFLSLEFHVDLLNLDEPSGRAMAHNLNI